jgi:plasmid maintenance system antidote protein VapI
MLLNLKNMIELHALPQYRLAELLGISESRLSRILAGRRQFTPEERTRVIEILKLLGIATDSNRLFEATRPGLRVLAGFEQNA